MSTLVEVNPQASPMQSMEESATYKHIFKVENKYPDRIQASCPNEYKLWFNNSVSVSLSMTLETQNVSSCNLSHRPSVFDIDLSLPPLSLSLCVCVHQRLTSVFCTIILYLTFLDKGHSPAPYLNNWLVSSQHLPVPGCCH